MKAVRKKTGLSQAGFASTYGLSAATLRDWEQNRKMPERTAQLYLRVPALSSGASSIFG